MRTFRQMEHVLRMTSVTFSVPLIGRLKVLDVTSGPSLDLPRPPELILCSDNEDLVLISFLVILIENVWLSCLSWLSGSDLGITILLKIVSKVDGASINLYIICINSARCYIIGQIHDCISMKQWGWYLGYWCSGWDRRQYLQTWIISYAMGNLC